MSVNFGNLDYYGHVPAKDLKETIRLIAYDKIHGLLSANPEKAVIENFQDYVDGIIYQTEAICDQIDEEVSMTSAEVQQIMQKYAEEHKDEPST